MDQLRFVHPDASIWLLAIPLIWVAIVLHRVLRERARRLSGLGPRPGTLAPLTGLRRDMTLLVVTTVAAVSLVFASARPQIPMRTPEYESVDLILLLDRSASMLAEDIRPSRLRRAGLEIRNFLQHQPDFIGRVALIGFAGSAVTLSHETNDQGIIRFYLDWIEEDTELLYGTNLTAALESALDLTRKDVLKRRKVVVIVSDGEDQAGTLHAVVGKFATGRIPIYTIGIGSKTEVQIPSHEGGVSTVLLDDSGAPLTTRFNESTLRSVAGATGARYYRSTTGNELGTALEEIANRERRIARWRNNEYQELYPWGLWFAAAALSWVLILL